MGIHERLVFPLYFINGHRIVRSRYQYRAVLTRPIGTREFVSASFNSLLYQLCIIVPYFANNLYYFLKKGNYDTCQILNGNQSTLGILVNCV